MLVLTPISIDNIPDIEDISYADMSDADKRRMVQESCDMRHDGRFFEMLSVTDGGQIVGFISFYAHSAHIIGIGPEIKKTFQGQGYGYRAEVLALEYARKKGFSIAVASVREGNAASIALHEKLGFEIGARCLSKHGNPIRIYIKAL